MYGFAGALLAGLIAFLGLGGRWAGWVGVASLAVYVLGQPLRHYGVGVDPPVAVPPATWDESLRNTVLHATLRFLPFLFPLTAAILDLALARRRTPP
jgi:hypothetical protein